MIFLKIMVDSTEINFICTYKSPKNNNFQYISNLENFFLSKDLSKPFFVIGDLNMDLLKDKTGSFYTDKGVQIHEMCENFNFKNFVNCPTRIAQYKDKVTRVVRTSTSLLDVVLHNSDLIQEIINVDCPFSDHKFVLFSINVKSIKTNEFMISCRNLSEKNMPNIVNAISEIDFGFIKKLRTVNEKYSAFSSALLKIIDKIAPLKSVKIKDKDDQTPWVDLELFQFKNIRYKAYSCCSVELRNIVNLRALNIMTEENKIKLSELEVNYNEYKKFYDYSKSNYQRLYRNKITDYFQTKTIKDL